jgi:hypothetical protein
MNINQIRSCSICKEDFVVGKRIIRVVLQDYIIGKNSNPKKQQNICKLCTGCWEKLIFGQKEVSDYTSFLSSDINNLVEKK